MQVLGNYYCHFSIPGSSLRNIPLEGERESGSVNIIAFLLQHPLNGNELVFLSSTIPLKIRKKGRGEKQPSTYMENLKLYVCLFVFLLSWALKTLNKKEEATHRKA